MTKDIKIDKKTNFAILKSRKTYYNWNCLKYILSNNTILFWQLTDILLSLYKNGRFYKIYINRELSSYTELIYIFCDSRDRIYVSIKFSAAILQSVKSFKLSSFLSNFILNFFNIFIWHIINARMVLGRKITKLLFAELFIETEI